MFKRTEKSFYREKIEISYIVLDILDNDRTYTLCNIFIAKTIYLLNN